MQIGTNPDYHDALAAVLGWWKDAGVDSAFEDEPRSWLPPIIAQTAPGAPPLPGMAVSGGREVPVEPVAEPPPLPDNLEAFQSWWLSEPALHEGRTASRVPPWGVANPELMIVVTMPESADRDQLMSGAEGKLIDAFLPLAGLSRDQIYIASALPCHSPAADLTPEANGLLGQALRRHVTLVEPKRLLVVGFNILPLLEHGLAQGPAVSSRFNHESATVSMLAVRRVPAMASQPRWKCILWQAWLDWLE
jgi:DNA polymerase